MHHFLIVSCAGRRKVLAFRASVGDVQRPPDMASTPALCRELTTLWVARLNDGAELKVTDPKEQQRDVEEKETEDKERRERVDC